MLAWTVTTALHAIFFLTVDMAIFSASIRRSPLLFGYHLHTKGHSCHGSVSCLLIRGGMKVTNTISAGACPRRRQSIVLREPKVSFGYHSIKHLNKLVLPRPYGQCAGCM